MSGTEMADHVRRTVTALRGEGLEAATAADPFVTVVAEVDCFDVGLRQDIPAEHAAVVDRLVEELADRDGVESVHIGIGRTYARTPVKMFLHGRHVLIIEPDTGDVLRDFLLDPTRDYQP